MHPNVVRFSGISLLLPHLRIKWLFIADTPSSSSSTCNAGWRSSPCTLLLTPLTFRSQALSPVTDNKFESIQLADLLDEDKLAGGMRVKLTSLDGEFMEG